MCISSWIPVLTKELAGFISDSSNYAAQELQAVFMKIGAVHNGSKWPLSLASGFSK
jgi:hypothetical protein